MQSSEPPVSSLADSIPSEIRQPAEVDVPQSALQPIWMLMWVLLILRLSNGFHTFILIKSKNILLNLYLCSYILIFKSSFFLVSHKFFNTILFLFHEYKNLSHLLVICTTVLFSSGVVSHFFQCSFFKLFWFFPFMVKSLLRCLVAFSAC